jgi:hypothetical protein
MEPDQAPSEPYQGLCQPARLVGQQLWQFAPRGDAELLEHLAKVVIHRIGADKQLSGFGGLIWA